MQNTVKNIFFISIITFAVFSCDETSKSKQASTDKALTESTEGTFEVESAPVLDTGKVYIASLGIFHEDEFSDEQTHFEWTGLFRDDNNKFYTAPIALDFERVHDGILDEEGAKTGWKITSKDASLRPVALLSGLNFNANKELLSIVVENGGLPANTSFLFDFCEHQYSLKSSGKITKDDGSDYFEPSTTDYRIELTKNDQKTPIVLMETDRLEESTPFIYFMGDLDGDGELDLLLETSDHYNVEAMSLFLSSRADSNEVIVPVAHFAAMGC